MLKKIIKIFSSIALIIILSVSNNVAYGETKIEFTDVPSDYWGRDNISWAASKSIINGYIEVDGTRTFKPEKTVTREEAFTMIYRTLEASNKLKSQEDYQEEYKLLFDENNIAPWSRKYLAYGLKYDLIKPREIKIMVGEDKLGLPADRLEIAIWSEKALDLRHSKVQVFPYEDVELLEKENDKDYKEEVDALYRWEIMQGSKKFEDNTLWFYPYSKVKRSEFAAICERMYNYFSEKNYGADYKVEKEFIQWKGKVIDVDYDLGYLEILNSDDLKDYIVTFSDDMLLKIDYEPVIYSEKDWENHLEKNGYKLIDKTIIITSMTKNENFYLKEGKIAGIDQVYMATKPLVYEGELVAKGELETGETFVGIKLDVNSVNGDKLLVNYFQVAEDITKKSDLKIGEDIKIIVDGNKIIELKEI